MLILVLFLVLLMPQNIYAKSNISSSISTFDELVNMLTNGVKLENIIITPKEVHVSDRSKRYCSKYITFERHNYYR